MDNIKLHLRDIHPQMRSFIINNIYPCHIRDNESYYVVVNNAMKNLLNLSEHYDIQGKHISEIPHNSFVFADEICQYDKMVIDSAKNLPVLKTLAFGRKPMTQPYIFDIHPFYDEDNSIVGTLAFAKPYQHFSLTRYIAKQQPVSTDAYTHIPYTKREQEIIFLICHGWTSKEAAKQLGISHRTVENKLCLLYHKAQVHNICQFREYCRGLGIANHIPESLLTPSVQALA